MPGNRPSISGRPAGMSRTPAPSDFTGNVNFSRGLNDRVSGLPSTPAPQITPTKTAPAPQPNSPFTPTLSALPTTVFNRDVLPLASMHGAPAANPQNVSATTSPSPPTGGMLNYPIAKGE